MIMPTRPLLLLPILFSFLPLHSAAVATISSSSENKQTYIIRVDGEAKPSVFPTHAHWYESTILSLSDDTATWPQGGPLIHTYSSVFHGFSARLAPSSAEALHSMPGIVAVIPEQVRQPDTTRSPRFLGLLSSPPSALLADSDFGSDLVIAVIDTGISPGHRSFGDRGLGPVPAKWKGACVAGPGFPPSSCNRKLVGARFFSGGYEATSGRMNESAELKSPRDTDGHGTHTASIAAGR